jgi:Tol biopolymer transport system component
VRLPAALLLIALLPLPTAAAGPRPGRIVFERSIGDQADLFSVRADGSGRIRLTRTPGYESEPSWGPNGRRIVAAGGPGLVELTPGGRLVRRLRLPGSLTQPRWSPDGRRIAYLALRCDVVSVGPGCADLWVVRPDGTVHRRLSLEGVDTTQNYGRLYSWAPGGRRIVFVSPKGLVVVDVDTGAKRLLAPTRGVLAQDPGWSPDGRWIAFTRQRRAFAGSDLYAVSPDGRRAHAVVRARDVARPAWSPDGRMLAYLEGSPSAGTNRRGVFVVDADGSGRRRIGTSDDFGSLVWSPDSSGLAWSNFDERLVVAPADGSRGQVQIARGASPDWR